MAFQLPRLRDTDWDGRVIVNGNQARVWKEAVTTNLLVLTPHLLGETEEIPE